MAVSLAVVGCLLLLGAILAVLWFRRRSARTSEDKSRGLYFLLFCYHAHFSYFLVSFLAVKIRIFISISC